MSSKLGKGEFLKAAALSAVLTFAPGAFAQSNDNAGQAPQLVTATKTAGNECNPHGLESITAKAKEYACHGAGIGIVLGLGKAEMDFVRSEGFSEDFFGRFYQNEFKKQGIESQFFYEVDESRPSGFVAFSIEGGQSYSVGNKSSFGVENGLAEIPQVAKLFIALRNNNPSPLALAR